MVLLAATRQLIGGPLAYRAYVRNTETGLAVEMCDHDHRSARTAKICASRMMRRHRATAVRIGEQTAVRISELTNGDEYDGHSVYTVAMSGRVMFLHAQIVKHAGDHYWSFKCPDAPFHVFPSKRAAWKAARFVGGNVCRLQSIKVTTVRGVTTWE